MDRRMFPLFASRRPWLLGLSVVITVPVVGGGCDDGSAGQRATYLAERVTHDQAAQNHRVAEATRSLTQGSRDLVAAESQARRDVIALQRDLRADQAEVGRQRDVLEQERRRSAADRAADASWSAALVSTGLLLACLAPLVVAGLTLRGLWLGPTDEEVGELLIEHWAPADPGLSLSSLAADDSRDVTASLLDSPPTSRASQLPKIPELPA